jgi:hypothetical protein
MHNPSTVKRNKSEEANTEGNEMKTRMLLLTLLCSCLFLMYAGKLQAQTPAQKLQQLSSALNLSPAQKTQLSPILEAEAPKIRAIKENPNLPPGQKAMQLQAIHEQSDPRVRAILSPQQYQEWQQIRKQEIQKAMQK